MSKTVLITGANKGIGYAVAQKFAQRGFRVWLGCRDRSRGEEAASSLKAQGADVQVAVIDVSDQASIIHAAGAFHDHTPVLDVLINNAGMHFGFPPEASGEPVEQMRTMFDTNVLGAVRVTQAFLPFMRLSEAPRIVMMSSGLGSLGATTDMTSENWGVGFAGYALSKSAINMYTLKLAKELMGAGFKVNAGDPGLTATDLTGQMGGRTPEQAAEIALHLGTLGAFGPTGGFFHMSSPGVLARHPW